MGVQVSSSHMEALHSFLGVNVLVWLSGVWLASLVCLWRSRVDLGLYIHVHPKLTAIPLCLLTGRCRLRPRNPHADPPGWRSGGWRRRGGQWPSDSAPPCPQPPCWGISTIPLPRRCYYPTPFAWQVSESALPSFYLASACAYVCHVSPI